VRNVREAHRVSFEGIIPWAFAVGHVAYGAMLGLTFSSVEERLGAGAGRST
jgi:shikimate kinase